MPPVKMRGTARPKNTRKTLSRLLSYMAHFKSLWIFVFICVLLTSGAEVMGTYLVKPVINDYIVPFIGRKNPPLQGFMFILIKLLTVYFIGSVSTFVAQRLLLKISTSTLFEIRKDLFLHQTTLPLKYFDSRPHGVLMSLYTNDTDTLRDMFSQSIPQLMTGLFQIIGIFCLMVYLSLPLALVMVVTVIGMVLITAKLGVLSAKSYRSQQSSIASVNGYIEELIEGQSVVKVFTREKESVKGFEKLNDNLCNEGTKASTYASILGPITNNLSHLQYALISVFGALMVIAGRIDLGTIASFLQSTRAFSRPLSQLSMQFNSILNALAGAERIFAAIDENSEVDEGCITLVNAFEAGLKNGEKKLVQSFATTGTWAWNCEKMGMIKELKGEVLFENVNFSYDGKVNILKNINLKAKSGQKIALVGSTGSGKTTITNLLTGFYELQEGQGTITFDGIPIKDIKKSALRSSIAMVLQDTHLFSATILENIRYGNLEATDAQVFAAAKLANADSFIQNLSEGYNTVVKGDGSNLSQGQRQLLAIARAAIANPPILILDEATSSIDTRTERLIEKGMDSLMKGRTVFIIAHRLSTVRNTDCIVVLENGSIIESGTHEDLLLKHGRYYELYTGSVQLD